jgi:hypothetical protein
MAAALTACDVDGSQIKAARENGSGPGKADDPAKKPQPPPAKLVEKTKALQFQKPTLEAADFLNTMELDLTTADRALFNFSHAADADGTFFFSLAQTRLHLQACSKPEDRSYKLRIFWSQVEGTKRTVLKEFTPSIDSFDFKAGGNYLLSYVLMDLKEFADCKAATLNFAAFLKNYK